jgi:hypothetical protein
VHRGCISELCGVKQRCLAAQELESTTQEDDLKVFEYLGGKAVYERHSCRQNSAVNSVELCQVGIERVHSGALRKELCCDFKRSRITEDSKSSVRWALSKCIGAQEDKIVEHSVKGKLCQVGIETVCR